MHNGIALNKACEYYDIMQVMYGHKFISQFNGMTDLNRILSIINSALSTVTDEQFHRGMAQLNTKAGSGDFCPTLSDFKTWCLAGSWWTADEAWQRACDFSNQSEFELLSAKLKITTLTKKAWDSVYWLVEQGGMREARKQFKSIYDAYLSKAQMQGRQQEWYVPPKMISAKPVVRDVKPKSLLPEQSPEQKVWVENRIKELQALGKTFPMAMFGAMQEMRDQGVGGGV